MNTNPPFYLFSVERAELGLQENGSRTAFVGEMMRKDGIHFIVVKGRWEGKEERAFLVLAPFYPFKEAMDTRHFIERVTRLYDQDAYIYIDANRHATLYTPEGGKIKDCGKWQEIKPEDATNCDAVTITPDGRHWRAA